MPLKRPSLNTLIDRAQTDISARIAGASASARRSLLGVLARMHSGAAHGLYGAIQWVALQIFPDTADTANLHRHADLWGITPLAATPATGEVVFTGANGAVVPAETEIQTGDGASYTTDTDGTISGGEAAISATAAAAGEAGNQPQGATLTLVSPVSGVRSQATVGTNGLTGGADSEGGDRLLARLEDRIQAPPHGGALSDYVTWTYTAHPAVTNAWASPLEMGIGTVTVRFMTYDATTSGIPDGTVVSTVDDYVQEHAPATADVYVVAPIADTLDFQIRDLEPDELAVRDAIETQLAELVPREAEPGGTIPITHIREAISIAAGVDDYTLVSPNADVTTATGHISVMGSITWS